MHLDVSSFNAVNKCWNTAFRWLFGFGKYESTRLLFYSCNTMSLKFLLDIKLMCFVRHIMDSSHNLLRNLCRFALYTDSFGLHNIFERYQLIMYSSISSINSSVRNAFVTYCNEL